ncbi:hypothetical protein EJ08DRAFT_698067 [Tothia fuscella]|uniref:Wax synthase domain-containing protein n=1 Tax=Tothia fuscella TaxID=1048955 RepID=A0A9P4NR85_9PEZI|nr:hypothetical protein EJ08DRAFT_698067 [Tothia fuscella]
MFNTTFEPSITGALLSCTIAHLIGLPAIAFIPPSAIKSRYAVLFLAFIPLTLSILQLDKTTSLGQYSKMYVLGVMLNAHDFLCLMRLSAPPGSWWSKWFWAMGSSFSSRRSLPPATTENNKFILGAATKWRVMAYHALKLGISIWMRDFFTGTGLYTCVRPLFEYFRPLGTNANIGESFLLNFPSYTPLDDLFRIYFIITILVPPYFLFTAVHSTAALLAVSLHLSDPSRWTTPLFGDIREAYSVRRWYSHFWHKLLRKSFTHNSAWIAQKVLRMRSGTCQYRIVMLFLVFALSGLLHTAALATNGGDCNDWMQMWYHFAIAVVMVLEDLVARVWCEGLSYLGVRRGWWIVRGEVLFGYVWLVLWFLEVMPLVFLPNIFCKAQV